MTLIALFLAACSGAAPAPAATEPPGALTAAPALAPTAEPTTEPTAAPQATEPPVAPTKAPTRAPTTEPTAESSESRVKPVEGAACLLGTWQATNLIELAAGMFISRGQAVPPDLAIAGGDLTVIFGPDGHGMYAYDNLTLDATIDAGGTMLPLKVLVDGQGSATYDANDAGSITFSDAEANELQVETTVGGVPVPMGALEEAFIIMEAESVTYSCEGNAVEFVFSERPLPALLLERVP
jgi:hypothetical protein